MTYQETTKRPRKARTPKTCAECLMEIAAGEIYIANSEKEGGKYKPLSRHADCIEAAAALHAEHPNENEVPLFLHVALKRTYFPYLKEILSEYPEVLKRIEGTDWQSC